MNIQEKETKNFHKLLFISFSYFGIQKSIEVSKNLYFDENCKDQKERFFSLLAQTVVSEIKDEYKIISNKINTYIKNIKRKLNI